MNETTPPPQFPPLVGAPLPSVIPTVEQMQAQARREQADAVRQKIDQMSTQELAAEIASNMPMGDVVKTLRDTFRSACPGADILVLATRKNKDFTNVSCELVGDLKTLGCGISEAMQHDHDWVVVFNTALTAFARTARPGEEEQVVTALQDIIFTMRDRITPEKRLRLLEGEVKRLTRAGRMDLVAEKRREIEELRCQMAAEAERQAKAEARRQQRLASLAKANEAKRLKKEREKEEELKGLQRESNNYQQPNFAKMAKQKKKKQAQQRAERKKKSGSAGSGESSVRSCSQLLSR